MYRFYLFIFTIFFFITQPVIAMEDTSFSGTWIANGNRHVFAGEDALELYNYQLTGHVNLNNSGIAGENDFWAQCNGLGTSRGDVVARCLWKDLDGNSLLLNLESIEFEKGREVFGVILRGTGPYKGITGKLLFTWSSMFHSEEAGKLHINGVVSDLQGHYILPKPKLN